jgi:hypothetical protein
MFSSMMALATHGELFPFRHLFCGFQVPEYAAADVYSFTLPPAPMYALTTAFHILYTYLNDATVVFAGLLGRLVVLVWCRQREWP